MTDETRNGRVRTSHHPRTDPEREGRDYYGIAPIKEHTWTWEVPVYFWLGGIGAGAHVVSTIARFLGSDDRAFLRASRYTTLLTMVLSPVLLIMDLGRPERFYNMLRIVKWRSAMSLVPMWARNAVLMGPTFLSSALSTGLSAVSLVLHLGGWGERRTLEFLRRAERMSLAIEAALVAASLVRMGRWSKPLLSKKLAPLFVGGTLVGGLAVPFALLWGRESRPKGVLVSVLVLLGGLAFRFAMIEGGRHSARDPQATFTFARKENLPLPQQNVQDGHASG